MPEGLGRTRWVDARLQRGMRGVRLRASRTWRSCRVRDYSIRISFVISDGHFYVGSYAMTHSPDIFRHGAAALRNSRDLSKEQRDRFITSANAAPPRLLLITTPSSGTASGSPVPLMTQGAWFESNTSTDEPVPEEEEPSKRPRKRSRATSNVSGGVQSRGRQLRQQGSPTGSSFTSQPPSANAND